MSGYAIGYTGHRPRNYSNGYLDPVSQKPFLNALSRGNLGSQILTQGKGGSCSGAADNVPRYANAPFATSQQPPCKETTNSNSYGAPHYNQMLQNPAGGGVTPREHSSMPNFSAAVVDNRTMISTTPYGLAQDTVTGCSSSSSRCLSSTDYATQLKNLKKEQFVDSKLQQCRAVPQFSVMNDGPGSGAQKQVGPRQTPDNFVSKVVEKYSKSVVRVETERTMNVSLDADIFSFFFGSAQKQKKEKVRGCGSGFCIENNIVLTNAHVIQGAEAISVVFPHGLRQKAQLLGADDVLDLAVLHISKCPSQVITLGNSSNLKQGDWSIVLGHPLGLNNTVTLGIISSLDRSSGESGWDWMRHSLIQTDAAVNQGNSGGPLLDELGQCVGIISMRALFGEGIGFAIPIDDVKAALPLLLKSKNVPHAYVGIKMSNHEDDFESLSESRKASKESNKSKNSCGSAFQTVSQPKIDAVLEGSPAAKGHLKVGDIITDVDGTPIRKLEEVQRKVKEAPIGKKMRFKVQRKVDGKDNKISITLSTGDVAELKKIQEKKDKEAKPNPTRIIVVPNAK